MAENRNTSRPPQAPQFGRPGRGPRNVYVEKPKNLKATLKKLMVYVGYKKALFISLMLIMFFTTILNLLSPIIQKVIIDALSPTSLKEIGKEAAWDIAFKFTVILGISYITVTLLSYFRSRISAKLSHETVRKIRSDLFEKFVKLPIKF